MSEAHQKGSEGLLRVALELERNGHVTYVPFISDHSEIDLIGMKFGKLFLYQVKYAGSVRAKNGHLKLDLTGSKGADYLAVFIPELDEVRFISCGLLPKGDSTDMSLDSDRWRKVVDL